MAKVTFENLTPKQAEVLASWFEGQGEQDCAVWFEAQEIPAPLTDTRRKGGYREINDKGDVTVYCRTPREA